MDYFKFDLQLFAATEVDLTNVKDVLNKADTVRYYAVKEGVGKWFESVADARDYGTIGAMLQNKTLTFAVGTESNPVLNITGTQSVANMDGVTIELRTTLTASGSTVNKGANVAGSVKFAGTPVTGLQAALPSGGTIVCTNLGGTLLATVPASTTVTGGTNTCTTTLESVFVVGATLKMAEGAADVTHGKTLTVGTNTYTEAGTGDSTARITAEATKVDGKITAIAAKGTLVTVNNTVSVVKPGDGGTIVTNGTEITAPATAGDFTVNSAGEITGLANGKTFVIDGTSYAVKAVDFNDDSTNDAEAIVVNGGLGGVFVLAADKDTPAKIAAVTVKTVAGGAATVTDPEKAGDDKTITALALGDTKLSIAPEAGKTYLSGAKTYYYVVKTNAAGTALELATVVNTAPANQTAAPYGYFEVKATVTGSKPTVTVAYKSWDENHKDANGDPAPQFVESQLLSNVTVDLTTVDSVSSDGTDANKTALKYVDVTGIGTGAVAVDNIPSTVEANVIGTKDADGTPTIPAFEDYQQSNALAEGTKMTLPSKDAFIKVTTTKDKYGVSNYVFTTLDAIGTTDLSDIGYFKVEQGTTGTPPKYTYTVSFVNKNGTAAAVPATLSGLAVDATGYDASSVASVTMARSTANETYDVTTNVGVEIPVATAGFVTRHWEGTPTDEITYKDYAGSAAEVPQTIKVTADMIGASGVYYYLVEGGSDNKGNNAITIKGPSAKDTAPTGDVAYLAVTVGTNSVAVAYTAINAGVRPTLYGLTKKVNVDATALGTGATITITDGEKAATNSGHVDFAISAPANANIVGNTEGEDTITYATSYVNAAEIDLSSLATLANGTYWFIATPDTEHAVKGMTNVTVGAYTTARAESQNAFKVVKTDTKYEVSYVPATAGEGVTVITFGSGNATLQVNGNRTITGIAVTRTEASGAEYKVTGATTAIEPPNGIVDTLKHTNPATPDTVTDETKVVAYTTYEKTWALDGASVPINLSTLDGSDADKKDVYFDVTKSAQDATKQGVMTFTVAVSSPASGATAPTANSYIQAHYSVDAAGKKIITLSFHVKEGTGVTREELANLAAKLAVNAAVPNGIDVIELTKDADGNINYALTELPSTVKVTNQGSSDTISYFKDYEMDETADTLTIEGAAGTYYYGVKTSGGDATKGKITISIGTDALPITKNTTAAQKAEIIAAAGGNYFKVVVDEKGNATVTYHPSTNEDKRADLSPAKFAVNVDASAMSDTATLTYARTADGTTAAAQVYKYNTTGLAATNLFAGEDLTTPDIPGNNPGVVTDPSATATYVPSYSFTGVNIGLAEPAGTEYPKTMYFEVVRTGGTGTFADKGVANYTIYGGVATAAGMVQDGGKHYFLVTYKTKYEVDVVYVNKDGNTAYDLTKIDAKAPINASALKDSSVDTLNIAVAGADDVGYAVTGVPDTVTVNKTDNDTVATVTTAALADGQKITLGSDAVAYYAVTGTDVKALTLGAKLTTKPDDTVNYFMVEKNASSGDYTITYVEAASGTAYTLTGKSSLTVDAVNVKGVSYGEDGKLIPSEDVFEYTGVTVNVTNAKGDVDTNAETVSYATTLDLTKAGEYYVEITKDADGNKTATVANGVTASTAPKDKKEYLKVSVVLDKDGVLRPMVEKGTAAGTAKIYTTDDTTGALVGGADYTLDPETAKLVLALPGTVGAKINLDGTAIASGPAAGIYFTEVTNVAKDSVLTNVNAATTVTTVSTLTSGDKVTISADGTITEATEVFTSGGGALSVKNAQAVSGTFILAKGAMTTLTGSDAAAVNALFATTAETGNVSVTFADGKITSVVGLDAGETLTITNGDYKGVYTVDGEGYVVKDGTYAWPGTSSATADILALGYNAEKTINTVGLFAWTGDSSAASDPSKTPNPKQTKFYLPVNATTNTATIAFSDTKVGDGTVASSGLYVIAEYDIATGTDQYVLKLTPAKPNNAGLLDPDPTFAGTIAVQAEGKKVIFTKDGSYTLNLTGAGDGSVFNYLGSADTVTSGVLAATNTIKIVTKKANGTDETDIYTNAVASGTLEFEDSKLKNGKVTVAATTNNDEVRTTDGTVLKTKTNTGTLAVTVEVVKGEIKSITGLDAVNDELEYTTKDGVTYNYKVTAVDGTSYEGTVKKTVTATDGSVTVTTLTLEDVTALAKDDILNPKTETAAAYKNNFAWGTKGVGYYNVTDTPTVAASTADVTPDSEKVYIKAEITAVDAKTGANTLKLTPMVVEGGKFVELAKGTKDVPAFTVNALTNPASPYDANTNPGTVLSYDGTGKAYKVAFTNAEVGSVFTNLGLGDTVSTTMNNTDEDGITVNGTQWVSASAVDEAFTVYSDNSAQSRVVQGTVTVSGTMNSTDDGTHLATLTYTKGSVKDWTYNDELTVVYGTAANIGGITSITGLERGASVTVVSTDSLGAKTTTVYQSAAADDGVTIYRIHTAADGAVTTGYQTTHATEGAVVSGTATDYTTFTTPAAYKAFDWNETTAGGTGYFLLTNHAGTVEKQSGDVTIDYTSYKQKVVKVAYDKGTHKLTFTEQVVEKDGTLSGGALDNTKDVLTIAADTRTIVTTARPNAKSLVITGAGAGSNIAGFSDNDSITTTTLKGAYTKADGTPVAAETITLAGHLYTAGSNCMMTVENGKVTSGIYLLKPASAGNSANTITAFAEDSTTKTTTKTLVTYTVGTGDVTATVANGVVTKLTGLGDGETATVKTTEIQKDGTTSEITATYTSTKITSGSQKDQFTVTKTMSDGRIYTHVFASESSDVLSSTVDWETKSQATETVFDWAETAKGSVGYFAASKNAKDETVYDVESGTKAVKVQPNTPPSAVIKITGDNAGDYYVRVTAEKQVTGVVKITAMELLVVKENGTFEAVTDKTIGTVNIDATAPAGIDLSSMKDRTAQVAISTPKENGSYTGLLAGDTISGTAATNFRVNGTTYAANAGAFTVNGDGTIHSGTFTVTDTVLTDEIGGTKVAYDKGTSVASPNGQDGVAVTVTYTEAVLNPDKTVKTPASTAITAITDLEAGEKVTLTEADGTVTTYTTADGTNITKTIKTTDGITETWKGIVAATGNDVVEPSGVGATAYSPSFSFDFGASTTGKLGYYNVTPGAVVPAVQTYSSTIAEVKDGTAAALAAGNRYVRVVAETKDGAVTISSLQLLKYDGTKKKLVVIDDGIDDNGKNENTTVSIASQGNMTLAENAIVLPSGDTERNFAIAITDAKKGEVFNGFAAQDTITFGALATGDTITVGGTTWKLAKAAIADATILCGDGTAKTGVFEMSASYKTLKGTAVDEDGGNVVSTLTTSGSNVAAVTFLNGAVTDITGLVGGQTATLETKNVKTGVTTKTIYSLVDNGNSTFTVTQTKTVDGVTTTTTGIVGVSSDGKTAANVVGKANDDPSASVSATFDWTTASGSGYFLVDGLTTETKKFGTVEIKQGTTTITKADAGKYYLKTELSKDGVVSGVSLVKVAADGQLVAAEAGLLGQVTEGKITIAAPAAEALEFDKALLGNNNIQVAVTGATAKSAIAGLTLKDTVTTAALTPSADAKKPGTGDYVTVNGSVFYAGAAGTMEFVGTGTLKKGTVKLYVPAGEKTPASTDAFEVSGEDASVATDDLTVTLGGTAPDKPVLVTVADGRVSAISDLVKQGTTLKVAYKNAPTNYAQYGYVKPAEPQKPYMTVTVALPTAGMTMKTVPLEKGTYVNGAFYAGANGEVSFINDGGLAVKSGTLTFKAGGTVIASGTNLETAKADNKTITFTQKAGNTSEVTITIVNGDVKSIKGLGAGDKIRILDAATSKATEYVADDVTGTKITRTIGDVPSGVATISAGADILSASYPAAGTEIDTTTDEAYGQLSWADVSGRSFGYFAMNAKSNVVENIAEQPSKKAATVKTGSAVFVKAGASTDEENNKAQILTIDALEVAKQADGTVKITKTLADTPTLIDNAKITVTAPTAKVTLADGVTQVVPAIVYDKNAAKYAITINKAAAGSKFVGLDAGDKVTTAALAQGSLITFDTTNVYKAGAKNVALTFVGEGESTADTPSNAVRLLTGTIQLDNAQKTALLSGATEKADTGAADDITVTFDDSQTAAVIGGGVSDDKVAVKVANGVVTSVTGLVSKNAKVTIAPTSGNGKAVVYTIVGDSADGKSTIVKREVFTITSGVLADTPDYKGYKTILDGKELDSASAYKVDGTGKTSYVEAKAITDTLLKDWKSGGKQYAYVNLTKAASDAGTSILGQDAAVTVTTTDAKTAGIASNVETAAFDPIPENYYLRVTATAKNGVTTISAVDLMQATTPNGKLTAVPAKTATFSGTLTIDGATVPSAANDSDGRISFALPKTRDWSLTAQNVQIGSTFTNLADGDKVTSADATNLDLAKGTVTLYHAAQDASEAWVTETVAVTYAGKDGVKYDATSGDVTKLTNLGTVGEKVTIVRNKALNGLATTVYEVTKTGLKRTRTLENGVQDIRTIAASESLDVLSTEAEALFDAATPEFQLVSNFDWTMDKASTGYFMVKSNAATVKPDAKPNVITSKTKNVSTLISVSLAQDGEVSAIKAVTFDFATGELKDATTPYTGKITLTGSTTQALNFDRAKLDATTIAADSTQLAFTGVLNRSVFTDLVVGDTVETAALKAAVPATATTPFVPAQRVTVNGAVYRAGANGKLGFTVQEVPVNDATTAQTTLTSGTIVLVGGPDNLGTNTAYVGKAAIVRALNEDLTAVGLDTEITVAASTNKNGVTSYTIGGLGDNESFQIGKTKYLKTPTALLKYEPDTSEAGFTVSTYAFKGTSVKSSTLDSAKTWKATEAVFTGSSNDNLTSKYTLNVDLAKADSRAKSEIAANKKAGNGEVAYRGTYDFVVDKYLAITSKTSGTLQAALVNSFAGGWEEQLGRVTDGSTTWRAWNGPKTYVATDHGTVGQNIKAANLWDVTGTQANDTITGAAAASGKDTLRGAAGNDLLIGGAAEDRFVVGVGNDTVKSFANGKDMLRFAGFTDVTLTGSDVLIWNDTNNDDVHDDDENSVLLLGMGNGKAVNINGQNFYFGNGKAKAGSAATFTYDFLVNDEAKGTEQSFYVANASLKNTLKVGTDKTKATKTTLGDTVNIDLTAKDAEEHSYYNDIHAIDASASGNRVALTASEKGSTLKGGTYQSTLKGGQGTDMLQGGSGEDVFWFDNLLGNDTVKNYATAKDALFLSDENLEVKIVADDTNTGVTIAAAADNKAIELKTSNNTLKIEGAVGATKPLRLSLDGTTKNTLSYYVGANGSSKKTAKNNYSLVLGTDTTATVEGGIADSMKSYYVGSASAIDTVKVTTADKKAIGSSAADKHATVSLLSNHMTSIDSIDASSLAKGSYIDLVGGLGDCTLKGSTSADSHETFKISYSDKTTAGKTTVIQNLTSLSDVIELAAGISISGPGTQKGNNVIYTLTDGVDTVGYLQVNGVKLANMSAPTKNTAGNYQIKRN